jgi:hypothetical protein
VDIFHLETEQGVQHTKLIISHLRKNDDVGKMIQILIDHLQLQAGTSWPVLSQNGNKVCMYIDPCYVSHTMGIPGQHWLPYTPGPKGVDAVATKR